MTDYIITEKGDEVISERHQKDFKKEYDADLVNDDATEVSEPSESAESRFTDVDFDDI
jgi:hypothetical protein